MKNNKKIISGLVAMMTVFGLISTVLALETTASFTDQKAYNIFKKALGGRYNLLDANQQSGYAGSWGNITTTTNKALILATQGSTTLDLFTATPIAVLDWFKTAFITDSALTIKEITGIKQALNARVNDLCSVDFAITAKEALSTSATTAYSTSDRRTAYKNELKTLATTRKTAIKTATTAYNDCINLLAPETRRIQMDTCAITKNLSINTAWTIYYNSALVKYNTFYGTTATAGTTYTSGTGPATTLNACKTTYSW